MAIGQHCDSNCPVSGVSPIRRHGISACHDKSRKQKKWTDTAIRRFDEGSTWWCLAEVLRHQAQQVQYLARTSQGGPGCPRTHTHEHTGMGPFVLCGRRGNVIMFAGGRGPEGRI